MLTSWCFNVSIGLSTCGDIVVRKSRRIKKTLVDSKDNLVYFACGFPIPGSLRVFIAALLPFGEVLLPSKFNPNLHIYEHTADQG